METNMHVVGGLYRELCEVPHWDAVFGSGGRAVCTVQGISSSVTLCTYARQLAAAESRFSEIPVVVNVQRSRTAIAVSYFHPLSDPHVEPARNAIPQEDPLRVSADVVLRFGMLEGDAVVAADTAVYDPQTHVSPTQFAANGSQAKRLALVLNEGEVLAMAGTADTAAGARAVLERAHAEVVVVKRGVRGALVLESGRAAEVVPAYRSASVFKIGTGDVFSGAFAAYWGERGCAAAEAADLASRTVARYAETRTLPAIPTETPVVLPCASASAIRIIGLGNTLSRRYLLEEAKYCLEKLGAPSVTIDTIAEPAKVLEPGETSLIIADGYPDSMWKGLDSITSSGKRPSLLFVDDPAIGPRWSQPRNNLIICTDFTTCLYETMWTAMGASVR
jgi:hypothetical protein